mgnify:CR=1 FL=1
MDEQNWNELLSALTENLSDEDIKLSIIQSDLASSIINKRNSLDMTQSEFAEYLGVKQSQISQWERGEINFTLRKLVCTANKLGLDLTVKMTHPNGTISADYAPPIRSNVISLAEYSSKKSEQVRYTQKNYSVFEYDELQEM